MACPWGKWVSLHFRPGTVGAFWSPAPRPCDKRSPLPPASREANVGDNSNVPLVPFQKPQAAMKTLLLFSKVCILFSPKLPGKCPTPRLPAPSLLACSCLTPA